MKTLSLADELLLSDTVIDGQTNKHKFANILFLQFVLDLNGT